MANIKKPFNFRNGFQIDDDNVVVNANGLVGIGTTIPKESLDVIGNVRVSGIASLESVFTKGITVKGNTVLESGSIGLATFSSSGIVSATSGILTYYGDGGNLANLPTSQWIDVNVIGTGFTSIYAQGYVGVSTNAPIFPFQVGGNSNFEFFAGGVGIDSGGNVLATGIITASTRFSGNGSGLTNLNASNVSSGTLSNDRLPTIDTTKLPSDITVSGIVSASQFSGEFIGTVRGNVVGIASTALSLTSTASIEIAELVVGVATCGVATISKLDVSRTGSTGTLGINTTTHRADLHISKSTGISSILLTSSPNSESLITLGRNFGTANGGLRFGFVSDPVSLRRFSNRNSLDLVNNDTGNTNFYQTNTSSNFYWIWGGNDPAMTLTSGGKLVVGGGTTVPGAETLRVTGVTTTTDDVFVNGDLSVTGNITGNVDVNVDNKNIDTTNAVGVSTFYNFNIRNKVSINGVTPFVSVPSADVIVGDVSATPRFNCVILNSETDTGIGTGVGIGIGTTALRNVTIGGISTTFRLDALQAAGIFRAVGVGTTSILGVVDFSNAGAGTTLRYMMVPRGSGTSGLAGANARFSGAILYDSSDNTFKGHNGTDWLTFSASAGGTNASTVTLANENTDTLAYVVFANDSTGNNALKTNGSLIFNSNTGVLVSSATTASTVTLANETADTTCFVVFSNDATGNRALKTNSSLTFNANTGVLGATVSNATNATNVALTASNTGSSFKVPFADTTGNASVTTGLLIDNSSTFTYNPSSDTLTVGNFVGNGSGLTNITATPSYGTPNSQSGAYTLQASDAGKIINFTPTTGGGGSNVEITLSSTLSASPGQQVIIYINNAAGGGALPAKLVPSGVTLYYGGTNNSITTSLQIDRNGVLTLLCLATDTYVAYGNNITVAP